MERNEFIKGIETYLLLYIAIWFVCLYIKILIWITVRIYHFVRYLLGLLVKLVQKMMMLFSNRVANFEGEWHD